MNRSRKLPADSRPNWSTICSSNSRWCSFKLRYNTISSYSYFPACSTKLANATPKYGAYSLFTANSTATFPCLADVRFLRVSVFPVVFFFFAFMDVNYEFTSPLISALCSRLKYALIFGTKNFSIK